MKLTERLAFCVLLPLALAASPGQADAGAPHPGRLGPDLYIAIGRRDLPAVKGLLARGADPSARNFLQMTPMAIAAGSGQVEALRALLAAGAKLEATTPYGTALSFAELGGNPAATEFLLARGAAVNPRRMDGITVLMLAARNGHTAIARELLARKADLQARDNDGATALMYAARAGWTETARFLLDQGASRDAVDSHGWTALMAAAANGRLDCVQLLLTRGATANARDQRGWTALMIAAADGEYPEVVRALLAGGADPQVEDRQNRTALALASARGHSGSVLALGGPSAAPVQVDARQTEATTRTAISASLSALQRSHALFLQRTGCASCHHQGLGMMAIGLAQERGFPIDRATAQAQAQRVYGDFADLRPLLLKAVKNPAETKNVPPADIGDLAPAFGFLLAGLSAQHQPGNEATAAAALVLGRTQAPDGHWGFGMPRVPIQSSFVTMTALAVQALQAYAPKPQSGEIAQRVDHAKAWLLAAPAPATEDKTFRLLGLKWVGASAAERAKAVAELLTGQRPDGGWAELPSLQSDAYATGQALYALNQAGRLPVSDPVYRRGAQFLLRTQEEDGSWFVSKRALPANNYFDAGFPHGESQYISHGATCWATMALMLTVDPPAAERQTAAR